MTIAETSAEFAAAVETRCARLRRDPAAFLILAMIARVFVGAEILLIFAVGQPADPARIRARGFMAAMTVGMHHATHHLALATGQNLHAH